MITSIHTLIYSDDANATRAFLRDVLGWKYVAEPVAVPSHKKLLPSYFYKPLLDLYLKDQETAKGEVGKIDFDPLYDSQDFEISDFNLVVLPNKKGLRYVAARFKNMGVDQEIIFALQRTKMGWRIGDIRYKDGRSLWKILRDKACA
jgi:hypothetical protein